MSPHLISTRSWPCPHSLLPPPQNPTTPSKPNSVSRRLLFLTGSSTSLSLFLSLCPLVPISSAETKSKSSNFLSGIGNTKSWFQFYGDGFYIRVPPDFQDISEPEDYNAGLSLYGDKAKPKTFAARFASSDGSADAIPISPGLINLVVVRLSYVASIPTFAGLINLLGCCCTSAISYQPSNGVVVVFLVPSLFAHCNCFLRIGSYLLLTIPILSGVEGTLYASEFHTDVA